MLVGIGIVLLLVPGIVIGIYFIFWQFSYVLRGKGISAFTYSKDLVSGNFVRVFLNVVGIWIVMYVLNNFVIGLIASNVANLVGEVDSIHMLVDAIFNALGKVFELNNFYVILVQKS